MVDTWKRWRFKCHFLMEKIIIKQWMIMDGIALFSTLPWIKTYGETCWSRAPWPDHELLKYLSQRALKKKHLRLINMYPQAYTCVVCIYIYIYVICLYIHITYIYIHMHIIYTKYITYTYANTYIYCKHLYTFVSSIRAKAAQVWWGHPRHFACECAVEDGTEGGLTRVAHICSNYCTGIWKFYLEWIANTTATRSFFWIHDGSENHSSEFLWASTRSALTDGSIIQRKLRVAIFITWAFFVRKQSQGPWASDVWA